MVLLMMIMLAKQKEESFIASQANLTSVFGGGF
jgi:hypothetical protein